MKERAGGTMSGETVSEGTSPVIPARVNITEIPPAVKCLRLDVTDVVFVWTWAENFRDEVVVVDDDDDPSSFVFKKEGPSPLV